MKPEDRWCAGCGRRLAAVTADGPVLSRDPATVACYWSAEPARLRARLPLSIDDPLRRPVAFRWVTESGTITANAEPAGTGTYLVSFETSICSAQPVYAWEGTLEVQVGGDSFPFRVRFFSPKGPSRVWLALRRRDPPSGEWLIVYRGSRRCHTYLTYEAGGSVPVQWEGIDCRHPAVHVRLIDPERASPQVEAHITWFPDRLTHDLPGEEVPFRLRLRGLPAVEFVQGVWWRLRRPLACEPAGLVVPTLQAGTTERHVVRVFNADREPLRLAPARGQDAWVEPTLPTVKLRPGDETRVVIALRGADLPPGPPPYRSQVVFQFEGRGRQLYPVCVEGVRKQRRLEGPLLVDLGPPGISLAALNTDGDRADCLASTGDGGADPEGFGLDVDDYAVAVGAGADSELVERWLGSIGALCREREHLEVERLVAVRHPWLPLGELADAELVDWAVLATAAACDAVEGPVAGVLRLDAATTCWTGSGCVTARVPLGVALAAWLARSLGPERPQVADRLARGRAILLVERLLRDYPGGEARAWRRLGRDWRRQLNPSAPPYSLSSTAAGEGLRRELAGFSAGLARGIRESAGAARVAVVGAFAASPPLAAAVAGPLRAAGIDVCCLPIIWLDALARRLARRTRARGLEYCGPQRGMEYC